MIALASCITATAFAGTSEMVIPAPAPEPSPSLGGWFVGGTYGQLDGLGSNFEGVLEDEIGSDFIARNNIQVTDFDFDLYSLHIGRDLGTQFLGIDVAAYLEVAYLTGDANVSGNFLTPSQFDNFDSNGFLDGLDSFGAFSETVDLDILPITLNIKLERNLVAGLGVYGTAGAGYAFSNVELLDESERDGGFYAQASAGLLYNINQSFEVYGGGRWLYLESVGIGDSDIELDNDFAWEAGVRYNF